MKSKPADLLSRVAPTDRGSGATKSQVRQATAQLGVCLPKSFADFLVKHGYVETPELAIFGLGPRTPRHLHLVRMAQSEIGGWADIAPMPAGALPIAPDGRGGVWFLDTARMRAGECPVMYWDHEFVEPGYRGELAARTFEGFLRRNLPKPDRPLPPPQSLTFDRAIAIMLKRVRRSGIVGDDTWKRGATPAQILRAERSLRLRFPNPYRTFLRKIDGFEHAGGWYIFGVSPRLNKNEQLTVRARAFWKASPGKRRLLPIAQSWVGQLCCLDLVSEPLAVVAATAGRIRRPLRSFRPIPFEEFIVLISNELDPWDPYQAPPRKPRAA